MQPWRRATLVASLIAAVELVALLLCITVIVAKPFAHAVQRHAQKVAATPIPAPVRKEIKRQAAPAPKPAVSRRQTKVLVLNGNGRTGAAHMEAAKLQSFGYRIAGAADAKRHDYATTVVMYRTGFRAEGVRLAHDLHIRVVGPLDGLRPTALAGGQLAVILGAS